MGESIPKDNTADAKTRKCEEQRMVDLILPGEVGAAEMLLTAELPLPFPTNQGCHGPAKGSPDTMLLTQLAQCFIEPRP